MIIDLSSQVKTINITLRTCKGQNVSLYVENLEMLRVTVAKFV